MTFDMERTLMIAVGLTIGYESRGFTLGSTIVVFIGGIIGGILSDLGRGSIWWLVTRLKQARQPVRRK